MQSDVSEMKCMVISGNEPVEVMSVATHNVAMHCLICKQLAGCLYLPIHAYSYIVSWEYGEAAVLAVQLLLTLLCVYIAATLLFLYDRDVHGLFDGGCN